MSYPFVILWAVFHQAPLSMGFSRQAYWSGLPFPSPGVLLDPGIKPASPRLAGGFFTTEPPRKPKATILQQKEIIGDLKRENIRQITN